MRCAACCHPLLLQAANLTIPADAAWTVFAPTSSAFSSSAIKDKTGLTAAQLLEPANKGALVKVRSSGTAGRQHQHTPRHGVGLWGYHQLCGCVVPSSCGPVVAVRAPSQSLWIHGGCVSQPLIQLQTQPGCSRALAASAS